MYLEKAIAQNQQDFLLICRQHKVRRMYAFGSSVTDKFDERRSDIDILVNVDISDPVERGESLLSLWDDLELFFGRKVDLLTEASLKNPYLKDNIDRTCKLIYDREGEKVFS
jgi:predicted nucleotidyltransferase